MAENGEVKVHEKTYSSFMNVMKWSTLVIAIIVLFVVLLIAG